ncbi:MAG: ROK family protein [Pirellulaceae bacterium]
MSKSALPVFVGVDVGGTNIKLGLVADDGTVLAKSSFPTQVDLGPQHVVEQTKIEVDRLVQTSDLAASQIVAVGLGTPGPMDIGRGLILQPTNLPTWKDFPIRDRLSSQLGLPVTFTNDANAAAYGEYWMGSANSYRSLVFFTLGTGVGGGIIVDDFCVEGAHSLGAELGHMVVDTRPEALVCSCGRPGHLEAYSSATAVVSRTRIGIASGVKTSLCDDENLTARTIFEAAEGDDELALQIVDETAHHLATGIAIVAHVIDPEAILFGGAMNFGGRDSKTGRRFLDQITKQVHNSVFPEIYNSLKIDFAQLGSDAGYIGAAGLARVQYQKHLRVASF